MPEEETHEDSCGRKGIGETPQCVARGGSPAARGKRNVFPERSMRSTITHYVVLYIICEGCKAIKVTKRAIKKDIPIFAECLSK
nr:hypothetical protein [Virgibacillus profundi]